MTAPPRILAIAGSDSSGGAGIQADIKTITMLGGYAMTAVTAVTAQSTLGVSSIETLSPQLVAAQIDASLGDIGADAIKIGMLGSPDIANAVADCLESVHVPVVFDPVMVATSGALLADEATVAAFGRLMEIAALTTPNLPELEALTGVSCTSEAAIFAAAQVFVDDYRCAVLAKGGHGNGDRVTDILLRADGSFTKFDDQRIATRHTHGTGCTLSSAIATLLGKGHPLDQAISEAREFVRKALIAAPGFGAGQGPMGHQAVR